MLCAACTSPAVRGRFCRTHAPSWIPHPKAPPPRMPTLAGFVFARSVRMLAPRWTPAAWESVTR
jgi:hypothetical protein